MRAKVMQKDGTAVNTSSEGFLLLDSFLNPIFVNPVATRILVYPLKPEAQKDLNGYISGRIRSALFADQQLLDGSADSILVAKFQSGRRTYLCRSFQVHRVPKGEPNASIAVLLQRSSARPPSLLQLSERFHLTTREEEVARFLLQGLTSKEIGVRMQISPNTVKAFLRLIMVKMGCSTRSGIVGKALTIEQ